MQIKKILFIFLIGFVTIAHAQQIKPKSNSKLLIENAVNTNVNPEDLRRKIEAFGSLLKVENDPQKRSSIRLARASLYLNLARKIRAAKRTTKLSAEELQALNSASLESSALIKFSKNNKDLSFAYYIRAMSEVDLDKIKEAVSDFQMSIKYDSQNERTAIVAIYLGEYYFEQEDYSNALKYYSNYAKSMNPKQQDLVFYKAAWCYVGQKSWIQAQQYFGRIITKSGKSAFSKDSLRDLAFVYTQANSEKEIIDKGLDLAAHNQDPELLFLTSAFSTLQRETKKKGLEIFKVLLEKTQDPVKRVELRLTLMRSLKTDDLSAVYLQAFIDLQKEIIAQYKVWPKIQEKLGKELQIESEQALSVTIEAYSSKEKANKASKSAVDVNATLKYLLKNYLAFYPQSTMNGKVVELLMDFCQNTNDEQCVRDVTSDILKNEKYKSLQERANLLIIDSIGKSPKSETEYQEALTQFIAKFPKSSKLPEAKKRLLNYFIKQKKWAEALPLAKDLVTENPSADDFFQLQWLRFQIGNFKEILDEPIQAYEKQDKRFTSLRRESTLKMAMQSKGDTDQDFSSYQNYIRDFIKMSDDETKKKSAILHFFELASKKKKYSESIKFYQTLSSSQKKDSDYIQWIKKILMDSFCEDRIEVMNLFFQDRDSSAFANFDEDRALYFVVTKSKELESIWPKLSQEKKNYFSGLLILTQPDLVLRMSHITSKSLIKDKAFNFLAMQISQAKELPDLSKEQKQILRDILPKDLKIYEEIILEKELKKILSRQAKAPKALKEVKSILELVQKSRPNVIKAMKTEPSVVKKRVLELAIKMESSTAELIMNSTTPKELAQDQIPEYKKGLEDLAKQFSDQQKEYAKISDKMTSTENANIKKELEKPNLGLWKLPISMNETLLKKRLESLGLSYLLALLDVQKGRHEIQEVDYYWLRSWLLINTGNLGLINYVHDELVSAKQQEILDAWIIKN